LVTRTPNLIAKFAYTERVEINGAIPLQLLGMNNVKEAFPAPIISLALSFIGVKSSLAKMLAYHRVEIMNIDSKTHATSYVVISMMETVESSSKGNTKCQP